MENYILKTTKTDDHAQKSVGLNTSEKSVPVQL